KGSNYCESVPATTAPVLNYSHILNLCLTPTIRHPRRLSILLACRPVFQRHPDSNIYQYSNQNHDHWESYSPVFHGVTVQSSSPIRIPVSAQFAASSSAAFRNPALNINGNR